MRRVAVTILGAVAAVSLAGCGNDGDTGPATGESLYRQNCAACHGGTGQGASGPALAGDDATAYSDAELTAIIADGQGSMPGFADRLDPAEIQMVVDHLRTLEADG